MRVTRPLDLTRESLVEPALAILHRGMEIGRAPDTPFPFKEKGAEHPAGIPSSPGGREGRGDLGGVGGLAPELCLAGVWRNGRAYKLDVSGSGADSIG